MPSLFVNDPQIIKLITEVRQGTVPLSQLHNKLGRYQTQQAISRFSEFALALNDYLENPLKHEWEFIKMCCTHHKGRQKIHYQLGKDIEVKKIGEKYIILEIRKKEE